MNRKVMATALPQPHMMSQCAAQRVRPRLKMKRFAANSTKKRRTIIACCSLPLRT